MKKIVLSASALALATTPILAVVSCGDPNDANPNNDIVIDLKKMDSPQELINTMNESIHFRMTDSSGQWTDAKSLANNFLDEQRYSEVKSYVQGIDASKNIKLVYNDQSYTWDLTKLNDLSEKMTNILENNTWDSLTLSGHSNSANEKVDSAESTAFASSVLMGSKMPEMSALAANLGGTAYGLKMAGFMELTSTADLDKYEGETNGEKNSIYSGITAEDKKTMLDNHEYIQLLSEWHNLIWDFVQSDIYDTWIEDGDKKFVLQSEKIKVMTVDSNFLAPIDLSTLHYEETKSDLDIQNFHGVEVEPGTRYDDVANVAKIDWSATGVTPVTHGDDDHYEMSNLEAQFVQSILGLDVIYQHDTPEFQKPSFGWTDDSVPTKTK